MAQEAPAAPQPIKLPAPTVGSFSLDKALKERQSVRTLSGPALSLETLSQLLWSAQGENRPPAREDRPAGRTVPSASGRYPLELYVIVAKSDALPEGVYKYSPKGHTLTKIKDGSPQSLLGSMPGMQPWIPGCPAVFVFAGADLRMGHNDLTQRELYTFWESGAAVQARLLQIVANDLGTTVVSGVDLNAVHAAAGLPAEERISVIIPVGRVAK
jgi:SagB-type dehydrogenase family enzyme